MRRIACGRWPGRDAVAWRQSESAGGEITIAPARRNVTASARRGPQPTCGADPACDGQAVRTGWTGLLI